MKNVKEPKTRRVGEMSKAIRAKVIKGIITPLEDFDLPEGKELTILYEDEKEEQAWKKFTQEQALKTGYDETDSIYDDLE